MLLINLIHTIFFVVYLGLAVYVLRRNKKASLNRALFLLMLVSSIQSLSLSIITYPTVDVSLANVFMDVFSSSLTAFGVFAFLSMVYITKMYKPGGLMYSILGLYFIGFIVFQITTGFASVSQRDSNGIWMMEFNNRYVLTFMDIMHNGLLLTGFVLLVVFLRTNSDHLKKKQIRILLITALISYSFSLTGILIPVFTDITRLPMLNDMYASVFLIGFVYSIGKYEFLEITPKQVVEHIIEMLPIGLIIADCNDEIVRINQALCSITKKPWGFFEESGLQPVFKELTNENFIDNYQNNNDFEKTEINTLSEKDRTVNIYFKRLIDEYNRKIGSITLIHDIDRLVKTEKELSKHNLYLEKMVRERTKELFEAKEKAEESDRLKTAFLHNISHEIRTPLNAISGFSGLLNGVHTTDDKRNKFISIIQNSSEQLLSIVNDVLTVSSLETHQEKVNLTKTNINAIMEDLAIAFDVQAKDKNLILDSSRGLNDKQSMVYTDKSKLTKILSNLLSNAIKFSHKGYIEFGYQLQGNHLEFYVKDTGIGIHPEQKHVVFERFRQGNISVSKEYGGTGLGLSIAKDFVELLGGEIRVESQVNKGSTFFFTIPFNPVNE